MQRLLTFFVATILFVVVEGTPENAAETTTSRNLTFATPWIEGEDPETKLCVVVDQGDDTAFHCTMRGNQMENELAKEQQINTGVAQRIDGSEEEKEGIRRVIGQMNEYFLNEVMVQPAYEEVRYRW